MLIADRYRLEEPLGRGGMGEVWRASDELLGRPVAVKLLSVQHRGETATARFATEARTAARLSHPNTVAVYDLGTVDERLYLVMELIDGYSLATEVAAFRRLDPRRVADLGAQAARGLAAAHAQGIVHRDIKPANLLLARDGTLKIGDFGIARFVDDTSAGGVTSTGLLIGTGSYMAPERALGRSSGPAADMYAFGCVLYELLTGQPPFCADTLAAMLYQHVETAPSDVRQHRPDLPTGLAALVHRLLAKDPEDRPTAQQVADWLATPAWQTGRPPAPTGSGGTDTAASEPSTTRFLPPPAHSAPPSTAPRSRRYLLAGAVMAAAAAAAVTALTVVPDNPGTPHAVTRSSPHPNIVPPTRPTPTKTVHAGPAAVGPAAQNNPKPPAAKAQPAPHPKRPAGPPPAKKAPPHPKPAP